MEMKQAESEKSTVGGNVEYTTEAERLQAIRESKYLTGSTRISLFFANLELTISLQRNSRSCLVECFSRSSSSHWIKRQSLLLTAAAETHNVVQNSRTSFSLHRLRV